MRRGDEVLTERQGSMGTVDRNTDNDRQVEEARTVATESRVSVSRTCRINLERSIHIR